MILIDLVYKPENPEIQYIIFATEDEIVGFDLHMTELYNSTFNDIYDYDMGLINKLKSDFQNIDRMARDYGHKSLEDFLDKYNNVRDEYPERIL